MPNKGDSVQIIYGEEWEMHEDLQFNPDCVDASPSQTNIVFEDITDYCINGCESIVEYCAAFCINMAECHGFQYVVDRSECSFCSNRLHEQQPTSNVGMYVYYRINSSKLYFLILEYTYQHPLFFWI